MTSATGTPSGSDPRKTLDLIRASHRRLNLVDLCKEEKVSRQRSLVGPITPFQSLIRRSHGADATRRPGQEHTVFSMIFFDSVCKVRRLDCSFLNPARVVLRRFFPHVFLSAGTPACQTEQTVSERSHSLTTPTSHSSPRAFPIAQKESESTWRAASHEHSVKEGEAESAADNPGHNI